LLPGQVLGIEFIVVEFLVYGWSEADDKDKLHCPGFSVDVM
jgi:hypothetical protein